MLDPETGWKVDFIVSEDQPFSRAEFESRREIQFLGLGLSIASVEDLIFAKLEWACLGNSDRQLRDVAEIIGFQGSRLKVARIEEWTAMLELESEWTLARELADPSNEFA